MLINLAVIWINLPAAFNKNTSTESGVEKAKVYKCSFRHQTRSLVHPCERALVPCHYCCVLARPQERAEWKWADVIRIIQWTSVKMYWVVLTERNIFHTVMATQLPKWEKEGHLLHRRKKKKVYEIIYNITHNHYLSQIILMPCLWYWLLCSALSCSSHKTLSYSLMAYQLKYLKHLQTNGSNCILDAGRPRGLLTAATVTFTCPGGGCCFSKNPVKNWLVNKKALFHK